MKEFNVPIIFIFFNRIETTIRTFTQIKKLQPSKLYLISDGGRNDEEKNEVEIIRKKVEDLIDWPCLVYKDYSENNLGCKRRVTTGISKTFENEQKAIILEDDCVPDLSFFYFCQEMLDKYEKDERIMTISGNLNVPNYNPKYSYLFARFLHVWGWATWKRAWNLYDINMDDYPSNRENDEWLSWLPKEVKRIKIRDFDAVYYKGLDTWDFQWQYSIWKNNGLCIKPNVNSIENIGFDEKATHTKTRIKLYDKITFSQIEFPLKHPDIVEIDNEYEKKIVNLILGKDM